MIDTARAALAQSLQSNATLQSFEMSCVTFDIGHALSRNVELLALWPSLAALARCGQGIGVRNLSGRDLRTKVLSFFAPPGCTSRPRFFPSVLDVHRELAPGRSNTEALLQEQ